MKPTLRRSVFMWALNIYFLALVLFVTPIFGIAPAIKVIVFILGYLKKVAEEMDYLWGKYASPILWAGSGCLWLFKKSNEFTPEEKLEMRRKRMENFKP